MAVLVKGEVEAKAESSLVFFNLVPSSLPDRNLATNQDFMHG